MTEPPAPAAPAERAATAAPAAPRGRRGTRVWIVVALVVGFLAHVAWRIWLARSVSTPVAHADEDRYLLSARALAGGPGGIGLDTAAFRRMGYPLILAPIYSYTSDPFEVYKATQVIGAVINALTFPLAYLFARRVFGIRPVLALALAFVAATLPAVVYYAEFALTDVLFPPLGLAWLLLLHGWLAGRTGFGRAAAGTAAGVVVGYAYTVHVRGLVMLGVHALVLAAFVVAKRSRWKIAVASLVAALLVTRVDALAQSLVGDRLSRGGVEPGGRLFDRLTDARGVVHILIDAFGQIWYAGVATWGLAAVGLVVAVARVREPELSDVDPPQRAILATTLVTTVLIALSSSAALPPDGRVSNHAYFRYIAFLMPVYVILAASVLIGAGRHRAASLVGRAAALVGIGAFFVLTQLIDFARQWYHAFDTPEIAFLTYTFDHMPVAEGSVLALILLAVFALAVARERARRATALALAGLLLLNLAAMEVVNAKSVRPMAAREYDIAPRLVHDLGVGEADHLVSSKRVALGARLNHQREFYWRAVPQFDHLVTGPPADATVTIAPWKSRNKDDWNGEPLGWVRIAQDPYQEWAVWFRQGDPRIEKARAAAEAHAARRK